MPSKNITIIGAGEIGRAIEKILQNKLEIRIKLWDKDSRKVSNQEDLAKVVPEADFLFFCVPSWALRGAIEETTPYLSKNTIIISLAKGIEKHTLKTMDKLLDELLPKAQLFALLGGPMLAAELKQGMLGVGIVGSRDRKVFRELVKLFKDTNLKLEYSSDIYSIALGSVLKNIYAIALGVVDGLKEGNNVKGWITMQAVNEMLEISQILGGERRVILGTAGLGDLVATGFSSYSRNRRVGDELTSNSHCLRSEGFISLSSVITLLGKATRRLPLLTALSRIIIKNEKAKKVFRQFIKKQS